MQVEHLERIDFAYLVLESSSEFDSDLGFKSYLKEKKKLFNEKLHIILDRSEKFKILTYEEFIELVPEDPLPDLIIVDDEIKTCRSILERSIVTNIPKKLIAFESISSVRRYIESRNSPSDLLTLDFGITGSGTEDIARTRELYGFIKEKWPYCVIMGLTNYENQHAAKELEDVMRSNSDSVYSKAFLDEDVFPTLLRNYYGIIENNKRLEHEKNEAKLDAFKNKEILKLATGLDDLSYLDDVQPPDTFKRLGIVGASRNMRALYKRIDTLKTSTRPIWVYGETGTGKESVVRALHEESDRASMPFIARNCAGMRDDDLNNSYLFGHLKGSFTGATEDRIGILEQANGGTLFLDEIHDMPIGIQQKILRAVQEKVVIPVGGEEKHSRKVNFKLIIASNVDLKERAESGEMQVDFYYRVVVNKIIIPPLRERDPEDIKAIARKKAYDYCKECGYEDIPLAEEVTDRMSFFKLQGNVRELETIVIASIEEARNNARNDHRLIVELHHLPRNIDLKDPDSSLMHLSYRSDKKINNARELMLKVDKAINKLKQENKKLPTREQINLELGYSQKSPFLTASFRLGYNESLTEEMKTILSKKEEVVKFPSLVEFALKKKTFTDDLKLHLQSLPFYPFN